MIVSGSASQKLAANVAKELDDVFIRVETKKFPDGEKYLRVHGEVDDEVTIIQSTGYPQDETLIELLFLIKNLKDLGAKKVRLGPDKVETTIADIDESDDDSSKVQISSVKGKQAIIIDDIIATGGTIVNAINILKEHGAVSVNVCCVHPTLVNDAVSKIYAAGATDLAGTDTLKSEVSSISLAKTIANYLKS